MRRIFSGCLPGSIVAAAMALFAFGLASTTASASGINADFKASTATGIVAASDTVAAGNAQTQVVISGSYVTDDAALLVELIIAIANGTCPAITTETLQLIPLDGQRADAAHGKLDADAIVMKAASTDAIDSSAVAGNDSAASNEQRLPAEIDII